MVESTASLHTQSPPFSIYRCYRGVCVWTDAITRGCRRAAEHMLLQMEWKHRNHVLAFSWRVGRHRGRSIDWVSAHVAPWPISWRTLLFGDWPALQLWEKGKAWWSVGDVQRCWVSTYSRLRADLTNLQREKEIRLQTQQKWSMRTPAASPDASWTTLNGLISSPIWTSFLRKTGFILCNLGLCLFSCFDISNHLSRVRELWSMSKVQVRGTSCHSLVLLIIMIWWFWDFDPDQLPAGEAMSSATLLSGCRLLVTSPHSRPNCKRLSRPEDFWVCL